MEKIPGVWQTNLLARQYIQGAQLGGEPAFTCHVMLPSPLSPATLSFVMGLSHWCFAKDICHTLGQKLHIAAHFVLLGLLV